MVHGKLDTSARRGAGISSAQDKTRFDHLRAEADAVLVGGRTLVHEDPRLTLKSAHLRTKRKGRGQEENPAKVGVVSMADLKLDGDFITAGPARRFIYTTRRTSPEQIALLKKAGAQVTVCGDEVVDLRLVMKSLCEQGIRNLMVEGGGTLIAELFRLGMVDEGYIYLAPLIFGGVSAPTLVDGPGFPFKQAPQLKLDSVKKFDGEGGILIHYLVPQS